MECYKCQGKGHIEGFAHVSEGRCFLCGGSGTLPDAKKKNIGYSRSFIREYIQSGFFPEDQSGMITIKPISMIGHPTAEGRLMKDGVYYYIGQPVCRSSSWFKIPSEKFPEFVLHYNKIYKTAI